MFRVELREEIDSEDVAETDGTRRFSGNSLVWIGGLGIRSGFRLRVNGTPRHTSKPSQTNPNHPI